MSTPPHCALFLYDLSGSGASRRAVTIASGLAARGHEVSLVLVRAHGQLVGSVPSTVRIVEIDPRGSLPSLLPGRRRLHLGASLPGLARWLRSARPDVLLSAASHAHFTAALAHRMAGRFARLVLRASNHLSASARGGVRRARPLRPLLARVLFRNAHTIVAVSRGVADDVARVTQFPRERIVTIYNPVVTTDLLARRDEAVDHPWLAPGEPPVVLGAGRLVARKDFATLVRAFARLRESRPARLVILGEGKTEAPREELRTLVARLGVATDVDLPGFVPNPLPWMRRASAFVLSSVWEGLPGVLIEALACGCPVVSTDCPSGPAEILTDGRYGRLVPVGDDAAMAAAIGETLSRPPERTVLERRALEFSEDAILDRYAEVLEGVAAAPTATTR